MDKHKQSLITLLGLLLCMAAVVGIVKYQAWAKDTAAQAQAEQQASRLLQQMKRVDQLLAKGEIRKAQRLIQEQHAHYDPLITRAPEFLQREQALAAAIKAEKEAHLAAEALKRLTAANALKAQKALAARQTALQKKIDSARLECRKAIRRFARDYYNIEFIRIEAHTSLDKGVLMTLDWLADKRYAAQQRFQSRCTFKDNQVIRLSVDETEVFKRG